jgi:DNA polymerase III subunit epsilon
MNLLSQKTFVIVDVETTGASPVFDRIIEIALLRVENGCITDKFSSLINPLTALSPFIERITNIKTEDLVGAPTFEEVRDKIESLLEGAVFVAHNARFDYGFVKNELKRSGVSFNSKCLCTVRLSRKLYPQYKKHDLSTLIDRFDFQCENRHRAEDDAKVLWDFITHIKNTGREAELNKALQSLLSENTLPQFLNEKSIKKLPEGPGVYVFYGEENEVLYVGKSKNIRYRVLSHFSNDHTSTKEMHLCQQTVRVEGIETCGELSALLLESEMVKNLSPIYNRQLRRHNQLVLAQKSSYGKYPSVSLERVTFIDPNDHKKILGVFKNISQAKSFLRNATDEYALCPKILGLEKGKGACFYHQINKCSGACVGKIEIKEYEKSLNLAFKGRKIRGWPFKGPIMIVEKKNDSVKQSFILDNWCLLHDIRTLPDSLEPRSYIPRFDYDSYKIFLRYIRNPLNKKNIINLNKRDVNNINEETENTEKYVYID